MAKETYATIYFDKDMTTEKSFGFDSFNENLLGNTMLSQLDIVKMKETISPIF